MIYITPAPLNHHTHRQAVRLQVQHMVRKCLGKYHDGWLRCSDNPKP